MGLVHDVIRSEGRQAALHTDFDRRVVEVASDYLSDEDGGIGWVYSGFAQAALPHKRLADDAAWQVETERAILMVEPGRRPISGGKSVMVGVPYGSRARLIMLYLMSRALETNSRDVELARSMRAWLEKMGIPRGGPSIKQVREQAERISRCRLTFHIQQDGRTGLVNQNIVDTAILLDAAEEERQGALFLEKARLSEGFFEQLKKHPVPIEESAIRSLNGHSMALDLYVWLAYRLHALPNARPITWTALKRQFGTGFNRIDHFRATFRENFQLALGAYPDADVTLTETGVTLRPSRPPVAPRASFLPAR